MYDVTREYRVSVYDDRLLDWLRDNDMTIMPLLNTCTRLADAGQHGNGPGLYLIETVGPDGVEHHWVYKDRLHEGRRLYGPVRWRAREVSTYVR